MATIAAGGTATSASLLAGIGDAFLVISAAAAVASVIAAIVLPSAASFLPKLRLAPRVAMHQKPRHRSRAKDIARTNRHRIASQQTIKTTRGSLRLPGAPRTAAQVGGKHERTDRPAPARHERPAGRDHV